MAQLVNSPQDIIPPLAGRALCFWTQESCFTTNVDLTYTDFRVESQNLCGHQPKDSKD